MTAVPPLPAPCQTGQAPHRWIRSARYTCRDCGHSTVSYAPLQRSFRREHPNECIPGAAVTCAGTYVRQLFCAFCGRFVDMLAR